VAEDAEDAAMECLGIDWALKRLLGMMGGLASLLGGDGGDGGDGSICSLASIPRLRRRIGNGLVDMRGEGAGGGGQSVSTIAKSRSQEVE